MNVEIEIEVFKEITAIEIQKLRDENLNLKIILAQVNKNLEETQQELYKLKLSPDIKADTSNVISLKDSLDSRLND